MRIIWFKRVRLADMFPHYSQRSNSTPPFLIPVEILSQEDETTLTEAQWYLQSFGFKRDKLSIVKFIQDTQITEVFKSELSGKIYPISRPTEFACIFQTWK